MGDRDWRPFIYGGLASITAEFGTFPIDTTKTRLQVQGQKIDNKYTELKYRGMTDAFVKIYKEEGSRALYSGIWPAVLRQATYGTIKFGTYYTLKQFINENQLFGTGDNVNLKPGNVESAKVNIFCAVVAGIVSSAIANPTDVLKVRLQVRGNRADQNLFRCFHEIYRTEGIRGLWRGVGPTSQRAAVIAAVELPVYDYCKHYLMESFGDQVANHFISSFIASLGSAIASTPIDVIRTRLMNQKRVQILTKEISLNNNVLEMKTKIYKGSIDCALETVRNEGVRALYKGFIPTWLRMGPWNIIFFITYEQLKKFH